MTHRFSLFTLTHVTRFSFIIRETGRRFSKGEKRKRNVVDHSLVFASLGFIRVTLITLCACVCVCVCVRLTRFSMLVLASAKASYHRTDKTDQLNWLCVSYLCICVCTYIYNIYVRIQRIDGYVCTVYVRGGTCAYVSGCTKGRIEKRKNSAQRREGKKKKRRKKEKPHLGGIARFYRGE